MTLPTRQTLIGMALGAVCASAVAAIGPGVVAQAFADEMRPAIDTSKLVKFDDRKYRINYEDWVSTDPISSNSIKKIEAGKVSHVTIATTATGTYSTDVLTSKHVQYPGIEVTEVLPRSFASFWYWDGGNWTRFYSYKGNSFVTVSNNGVRVHTSSYGTCVSGKGFYVC